MCLVLNFQFLIIIKVNYFQLSPNLNRQQTIFYKIKKNERERKNKYKKKCQKLQNLKLFNKLLSKII